MDIESFAQVSPRRMKELVKDAIESRLVPYVKASPGTGKSTIIHGIAEEYNLEMRDHRISTSAAEDFNGLPEFYNNELGQRRARFVPFDDIFPLRGSEPMKGKDGWMLFMDEFNHGDSQVMSASYKLLLDKMVGQHHIDERVVQVLAGNLDTDRAMTNEIGTALQSRVVHIQMIPNHIELREDVMIPQDWDTRVIMFLEQFPSKISNFRPDHKDQTFACPRTWEFMSRLMKGKDYKINNGVFEMDAKMPLHAGTIGAGMAAEFNAFCRTYGNLPSIQEILKDPANTPVPFDPTTCWATIGLLVEHTDPKTFVDIATYADQFRMNFRIIFYKMTLQRHPTIRQMPEYRSKMVELSRYLS